MRAIIRTPCPSCKKAFARYSRGKRVQTYCSLSCAARRGGEARSRGQRSTKDQTGAKNPNWKGGISFEPYRYTKKFKAANPEKARAHRKVYHAVKKGRLLRSPCVDCATTIRVHAHHHDYSRPLDVTWLCQPCHNQRHAAERRSVW